MPRQSVQGTIQDPGMLRLILASIGLQQFCMQLGLAPDWKVRKVGGVCSVKNLVQSSQMPVLASPSPPLSATETMQSGQCALPMQGWCCDVSLGIDCAT